MYVYSHSFNLTLYIYYTFTIHNSARVNFCDNSSPPSKKKLKVDGELSNDDVIDLSGECINYEY